MSLLCRCLKLLQTSCITAVNMPSMILCLWVSQLQKTLLKIKSPALYCSGILELLMCFVVPLIDFFFLIERIWSSNINSLFDLKWTKPQAIIWLYPQISWLEMFMLSMKRRVKAPSKQTICAAKTKPTHEWILALGHSTDELFALWWCPLMWLCLLQIKGEVRVGGSQPH